MATADKLMQQTHHNTLGPYIRIMYSLTTKEKQKRNITDVEAPQLAVTYHRNGENFGRVVRVHLFCGKKAGGIWAKIS